MNCSTPVRPVHHQLSEFTQTHLHWVSDAIQQSHPLLSPSAPVFNLSQYQGLFQSHFFTSGGQSVGVSASASVLPMNIQDWFPLGWTGWISLLSKGLSKSSPTPQLKSINSPALRFLYSPTIKTIPLTTRTFVSKVISLCFCSARSPNPWLGKKTLCDNVTCNRGIYYSLQPGPPALTKGVRMKRPRAPVLSGIYWVQLLVGTSGLVTQLQGNFCWPNPSWAFSFPVIGSLFLARHMLIGWLQVAW